MARERREPAPFSHFLEPAATGDGKVCRRGRLARDELDVGAPHGRGGLEPLTELERSLQRLIAETPRALEVTDHGIEQPHLGEHRRAPRDDLCVRLEPGEGLVDGHRAKHVAGSHEHGCLLDEMHVAGAGRVLPHLLEYLGLPRPPAQEVRGVRERAVRVGEADVVARLAEDLEPALTQLPHAGARAARKQAVLGCVEPRAQRTRRISSALGAGRELRSGVHCPRQLAAGEARLDEP